MQRGVRRAAQQRDKEQGRGELFLLPGSNASIGSKSSWSSASPDTIGTRHLSCPWCRSLWGCLHVFVSRVCPEAPPIFLRNRSNLLKELLSWLLAVRSCLLYYADLPPPRPLALFNRGPPDLANGPLPVHTGVGFKSPSPFGGWLRQCVYAAGRTPTQSLAAAFTQSWCIYLSAHTPFFETRES